MFLVFVSLYIFCHSAVGQDSSYYRYPFCDLSAGKTFHDLSPAMQGYIVLKDLDTSEILKINHIRKYNNPVVYSFINQFYNNDTIHGLIGYYYKIVPFSIYKAQSADEKYRCFMDIEIPPKYIKSISLTDDSLAKRSWYLAHLKLNNGCDENCLYRLIKRNKSTSIYDGFDRTYFVPKSKVRFPEDHLVKRNLFKDPSSLKYSPEILVLVKNDVTSKILDAISLFGKSLSYKKKHVLSFINKRYNKDFSLSDFKSIGQMVDYILSREM
jgi:hypothetical protein